MAVYKKRRVNRFKSVPKRLANNKRKESRAKPEKIEMSENLPKRESAANDSFKVVKGRKLEQKRRTRNILVVLASIFVLLIIFQLSLPIGIVDSLENLTAVVGNGSYPISLSGTETYNSSAKNGYYFTLNNSSLQAFSNSGKKTLSVVHGFEKPILKTSETRALVFDQGGNSVIVYNLHSEKNNKTFEENILCAAISRCGTYAVATTSESYAGVVSVYDKNDKLLYEWYSATDLINNVALSPNGKKLAVSTVNSKGGELEANVYVLKYDSATPVFSQKYSGEAVYSLENSGNRGFMIISSQKIEFVKWGRFKTKVHESDYEINIFRNNGSQTVAVFNRSSNRTDNKICVFSSSGELKYEIEYNGLISDISVYGNHIYCMNDSQITVIDKQGEVILSPQISFGGEKLIVLSSNKVAVITDSEVKLVKLEE